MGVATLGVTEWAVMLALGALVVAGVVFSVFDYIRVRRNGHRG